MRVLSEGDGTALDRLADEIRQAHQQMLAEGSPVPLIRGQRIAEERPLYQRFLSGLKHWVLWSGEAWPLCFVSNLGSEFRIGLVMIALAGSVIPTMAVVAFMEMDHTLLLRSVGVSTGLYLTFGAIYHYYMQQWS